MKEYELKLVPFLCGGTFKGVTHIDFQKLY